MDPTNSADNSKLEALALLKLFRSQPVPISKVSDDLLTSSLIKLQEIQKIHWPTIGWERIRELSSKFTEDDIPQQDIRQNITLPRKEWLVAVTFLPPLPSNPLAIDETWKWVVASDKHRYNRRVTQDLQLCAVDSVIMMAFYMNLGLVKVDQLPLETLRELKVPARALRNMIARRWGFFKQATLNDMRLQIARQAINYSTSGTQQEIGKDLAIDPIVIDLMDNVRQIKVTLMTLAGCQACGAFQFTSPPPIKAIPYELFSLAVSGSIKRVKQALGEFFSPRRIDVKGHTDCEVCSGICRIVRVVIDRLPPRLLIGFLDPPSTDAKEIWEKVKVEVYVLKNYGLGQSRIEKERASYYVKGVILKADRPSHFYTIWIPDSSREEILDLDGMKNDTEKHISREDLKRRNHEIVYMLLERKAQQLSLGIS